MSSGSEVSDMKKLTFVFDEDLFGAFQRGDWRKQDEVKIAIEHFLVDASEIRASNGEGFYRRGDVNVLFIFDKKNNELILEIYDEVTLRPILLLIGHDEKIMIEKRGSVAYVILKFLTNKEG